MNQPKLWKTLAIASVAGVIGAVGIQSNAQAGSLVNQGYSVFAAPDPVVPGFPNVEPNPGDPNSQQCAFCDSTVSFAVYKPDTEDWVSEFATQYGIDESAIVSLYNDLDRNAPWVFLYEVVNTDPLPAAEDNLLAFDIAVETKPPIGPWFGPSPYSSGGYIDGTVFTNASTDIEDNPGTPGAPTIPNGTRQKPQPCLNDIVEPSPDDGCPGNWIPDVLGSEFIIGAGEGVDPVIVDYVLMRDDEVERQQAGLGIPLTSPTNGMTFQWNPVDPIAPGENSSLLFLTAESEEEFIQKLQDPDDPNFDPELAAWADDFWITKSYPWAKTQSPVGEGTSGDVAGLKITTKKTPEPTTILGLLAVSGFGVAAKRKKQNNSYLHLSDTDNC